MDIRPCSRLARNTCMTEAAAAQPGAAGAGAPSGTYATPPATLRSPLNYDIYLPEPALCYTDQRWSRAHRSFRP